MKLWILFVILHGIFKGFRDPVKKKALEKSDTLSCLFMYTLIGFLMSVPFLRGGLLISPRMFLWVGLKSFVIFLAWMAAFVSIKKLPVSLFGVVDMSRVIFSSSFGMIFLGEPLTHKVVMSIFLVALGVFLVNRKKKDGSETYEMKYVWIVIAGCVFNAMSGVLDKFIMSGGEITASQLQFWFMLMLTVFYGVYIFFSGNKVDFKGSLKNPGIYLMSLLLVAGDKLLFAANADPESRVTVMTVIKQSAVLVTIFLGKVIYKEKNMAYKVFCACIILAGILISVIK